MANKDYYKILGVDKNASDDEIKKAFRKLAHQHHPDKQGGDASKFKEINEANQILSDKTKRAQYDQFGSEYANQPGAGGSPYGGRGNSQGGFEFNFGNAEDLGDLFGGMGDMFGFGGQGGGRSRGGRSQQQRGEDVAVDLELKLHDAVFGVEETFKLNKLATCDTCHGSGGAPGSKIDTCKTCGGHGQVIRVQNTILGAIQTAATCSDCHGSGKKPEKPCPECHGAGAHKKIQEITIKIPAGIHDGESIRVTGRGAAAAHGGHPGDLYVRIRVASEKNLRVQGDDIYSEARISFPTAALGGEAKTHTVEGEITIKIPEGVQSGELIRLKGKGGMKRGGARADHFVRVTIETPKKLTKATKKLLEQLRGELE
ncbi:MAG: molecular chaperone DnaJ [Candidatus Magasanikbacteria bacterium]|nr:molecular chaperone DnaJ [Candidatus Magasanikbacteria bacterium]